MVRHVHAHEQRARINGDIDAYTNDGVSSEDVLSFGSGGNDFSPGVEETGDTVNFTCFLFTADLIS